MPARVEKDDPYIENLLKSVVEGKTVLQFEKGTSIFSQGDKADAIYFIQAGKAKISVNDTKEIEEIPLRRAPNTSTILEKK